MTKEQYEKISNRINELYKIINEGKGYNPYRDSKGRFANGPSAAFGKFAASSDSERNPNFGGFTPDSITGNIKSRLDKTRSKALIEVGAAIHKMAKSGDYIRGEDKGLDAHEAEYNMAVTKARNAESMIGQIHNFATYAATKRTEDGYREDYFKTTANLLKQAPKHLDALTIASERFAKRAGKDAPKNVELISGKEKALRAAYNTLIEINKHGSMKNPLKEISLK